jgi:hypothetical protein
MTRKDFELIASVIRNTDEVADSQTRDALAEMFADKLAGTNDRFNRETFLKACGVSND